ncbi:MAG: glutathione S-transferase family protein [Paracoccaceae bacterium]
MKLYQFDLAPSSNRVALFLKETGINVPIVQLNVRDGDQFKEPYNSLNPFHCVPFLELDSGIVISESLAICRYLEESENVSIKLFGTTPQERATIEMWNRRLEIDGYLPLMNGIRNKFERYKGKVLSGTRNDLPQFPAIAEWGVESCRILFKRLNAHLQTTTNVAGDTFSIADITGYEVVQRAIAIEMNFDEFEQISAWYEKLDRRFKFNG